MENQNERDDVFSKKIRAGKRTYFFDVKATRGSDYFITITESKRKFQEMGYIKHKIFLYKEDFNKFVQALNETVDHVKKELLPDYNFEEFDRESAEETKSNPGDVPKEDESKANNVSKNETIESTELKWD